MSENVPGEAAGSEGRIIIVSGMPRSGTSMMMQMLEAAGLAIHSDGRRAADIDNPNGYLELEATKRLKTDAAFLAQACGRVVKVVAPLLPHLPVRYEYRVIFMERAIEEVLASQSAMLARLGRGSESDGGSVAESLSTQLVEAFRQVSKNVKAWLDGSGNVMTCFVEHRSVLASPLEASRETLRFLHESEGREGDFGLAGDSSMDREEMALRMAAVVDPALYRQRL
ncbi:MAG: hypothetical protein ABGX04_07305 [Myxococcales bacterium]|nr:sulfotransferase family protein [Myxococcales bacterium]HIK85903.1 sulfotransferase family protein [Myxococcales bacterium]